VTAQVGGKLKRFFPLFTAVLVVGCLCGIPPVLLGAPVWWSLVIGSLLLFAITAMALLTPWRTQTVNLDEATDALAMAIEWQWQREMHGRLPPPAHHLSVRWTTGHSAISDHWVGNSPADVSTTLRHEGESADIAEFFARLPSHRLVVLGPPGSGKTFLCMQLVIKLLEDRRSGDPVPVLLSISSWDPSAKPYRQWLVERLTADYPALPSSSGPGVSTADLLVRAGRILPVVDGLDELPPRRRATALAQLNASLTALDALVLTSRSEPFNTHVRATGRVLARAVVVELQPLQPATVVDYLRLTMPPRQSEVFARVLGKSMHEPANTPLWPILSSPLMLELFRAAHEDPDADPMKLLNRERFPDSASIEDWLLQSFMIHAAFGSRSWPLTGEGGSARVDRWLSFLSADLLRSGRTELSWWELEQSAPSWVPTGVGAVLVGVGNGASVMARYGALPGFVAATVSAAGAACLGYLLMRRQPSGVRAASFPALSHTVAARALLVGLAACAPMGLATAQTIGRVAGTGVALVLFASIGVTAWLTQHVSDMHSSPPRVAVRASRLLAVSSWLSLALSLAVTWSLVARRLGTNEVTVALVAAATTLPWLTNATAWGRFVTARMWLAAHGRLPWRFLRFLDEMWRMGLIRRSGGSYQFRHARLLTALAHPYSQSGLAKGETGR